jgi:hypothetical protein
MRVRARSQVFASASLPGDLPPDFDLRYTPELQRLRRQFVRGRLAQAAAILATVPDGCDDPEELMAAAGAAARALRDAEAEIVRRGIW